MPAPPLLVSPVDRLPEADRKQFDLNVAEIGNAVDGDVVSCPFPIAMYHRIDGIWLPVSDLGAFHAAPSGESERREPVESSYIPPQFVVDSDGD